MYYILDENNKVKPANLQEWAEFFSDDRRILKQERVGDYWISTVFLGIDHRFGTESGEPILFETMIFPVDDFEEKTMLEEDMERYTSYVEALGGHERMVRKWRPASDQAL